MTDPTEAISNLEAYQEAVREPINLREWVADYENSGRLCDAIQDLLDRLDSAEAEVLEQARLNGMGSEREAALLARLDSAERDQRRYQILRGNYLRVFMADKTGDVAFDIECEDPELNSESDGTRLDAAIDAALGDVGV